MFRTGVLSLAFALVVFAAPVSAYAARAIATTTAIEIAQKTITTSAETIPVAMLVEDSKHRSWMVVDFFHWSGKKQFYEGRAILDPRSGKVMSPTGKNVGFGATVDDLQSLYSVMADPETREVRFWITEDDARNAAAQALGLTGEYSVLTSGLREGEYQYYYVIDFVRYDSFAKKFYWGQRAVVNPYDGTVVNDPAVLKAFAARVTDVPEGFDPLTKMQLSDTRSIGGDLTAIIGSIYWRIGFGAFFALLFGVPYLLRRYHLGVSMGKVIDVVFGLATATQVIFAFYLYRYSDDMNFSWIWLLMSAVGTGTSWIMARIYMRQMPGMDNKTEFSPVGANDVKKLTWDDLIIDSVTLAELKRAVRLIENPDMTAQLGIDPPKGILLYGPPGTGKTTVAKVLANEAKAAFFAISFADVNSMWWGQSEEKVRALFQEARKHKPSIIFIDEIDSLMSKRGNESMAYGDKITNQVLQEIDGIRDSNNVFVVGATNAPDSIDPALLRGGRLSTQIEIPLPDEDGRGRLFTLYLKRSTLAPDVNTALLAQKTPGYSGADIKDVCEKAIVSAFESNRSTTFKLSQADLEVAIASYARTSRVYHVPDYFKRSPSVPVVA